MPRRNSGLALPDGPQRLALMPGYEGALAQILLEAGPRHGERRVEQSIMERLGSMVGNLGASSPASAAQACWAPDVPDWAEDGEPNAAGYTLIDGDLALMSIDGFLFPRGFYSEWSGRYYPGYSDYITAAAAARADGRVRAVVAAYNTPGGYVSGSWDAAKAFREGNAAHGGKPLIGHAALAASAGQLLFGQCDACYAADGANVGSVGIRVGFYTLAAAMEKWGERFHSYTSGELKEIGAFWREPTEAESARIQTEVDYLASRFYAELAAGRGLDLAALTASHGWEAATFTAGDPEPDASINAMRDDVGLVDAVMTLEQACDAARAMAGAGRKTISTPVTPAGANSRAPRASKPRNPAGSTQEEPDMAKASAQLAALLGKKKAGTASKAELAELTAIGAMLAADDSAEEQAVDDNEEEAADDDTEEEVAEGEGDDAPPPDEEDDADPEAASSRVLASTEAKSRPALAGMLATKVALGKLTSTEAIGMLAKAGKEGSAFRAAAAGNTPPGGRPAGQPGEKDQAQAALSAAFKKRSRT